MQIINFEVLVVVGVAAFVLAKLWSVLTDRLPFWARLPEWGRELGGYLMMLANGALMWATALDMLPGFGVVVPWLGRALTCLVAACGPSVVYDMWLDKPEPPAQ